VASRTNGTIGALLNATFGNAPELLISTAALRAGFYRVVQLAMLGSMLTNLLFVFGLSCLVGGIRWQVQELRIPSGGVSVGLLLMATAGSLLPAALEMSGQFPKQPKDEDIPTREELQFCRVNAVVMIFTYICYLMFQLGTHKEEFDDDQHETDNSSDQKEDGNRDDTGGEMQQLFVSQTTRGNQGKRGMRAHPNVFCMRYFWCCKHNDLAKSSASTVESAVSNEDVEIAVGSPDIGLKPRADGDMPGYDEQQPTNRRHSNDGAAGDVSPSPYVNGQHQESIVSTLAGNEVLTTINEGSTATSAKTPHLRRKKNSFEESSPLHESLPLSKQNKMNRSDRNLVQRAAQPEDLEERTEKGTISLFSLRCCYVVVG
jgi:Ca2+/Na+ antiporter